MGLGSSLSNQRAEELSRPFSHKQTGATVMMPLNFFATRVARTPMNPRGRGPYHISVGRRKICSPARHPHHGRVGGTTLPLEAARSHAASSSQARPRTQGAELPVRAGRRPLSCLVPEGLCLDSPAKDALSSSAAQFPHSRIRTTLKQSPANACDLPGPPKTTSSNRRLITLAPLFPWSQR